MGRTAWSEQQSIVLLASEHSQAVKASDGVERALQFSGIRQPSTVTGVEGALAGCAFLSNIRVWPAELKTGARRWLANFSESEKEYAAALLDSFIFFSHQLVDRLFVAAFDALATEVTTADATYSDRKLHWGAFTDQVLVTHPTGEMPNVTDSGYAFDRRARQLLNIDQSHILEPQDVVVELKKSGPKPVVFVDDFAGSGDQFRNTWHRLYNTSSGRLSFALLAGRPDAGPFYYCPLLCTTRGLSVIQRECPGLLVRPTHLLPEVYAANHAASLLWPDALRAGSVSFVETTSSRAGISPTKCWGYAELGLSLAFEHGVPDATLPILWWEENGWTPLMRRR